MIIEQPIGGGIEKIMGRSRMIAHAMTNKFAHNVTSSIVKNAIKVGHFQRSDRDCIIVICGNIQLLMDMHMRKRDYD